MEAEKMGPKEIAIHIDKQVCKVTGDVMTGAQIRGLVTPPLAPSYDLYLEVPSNDDHLVMDGEAVSLKPGLHFFSAPSTTVVFISSVSVF